MELSNRAPKRWRPETVTRNRLQYHKSAEISTALHVCPDAAADMQQQADILADTKRPLGATTLTRISSRPDGIHIFSVDDNRSDSAAEDGDAALGRVPAGCHIRVLMPV